mgnify:CR=1 FL=1|tara:strand:- start:62 stop:268 length:207 start_codon:yes stop_codon:yes gene_type:complete
MLIKRKSPFTGSINTMEIPVTKEELSCYFNNKNNIQDVFPHLTPSQREFIKTGITDKEWEETFGRDDA